MSSNEEERKPPVAEDGEASLWTEPLNIKVNDNNNNELRFKIRRWTKLEKLMKAFCERNGKVPETVRFFYDGKRVLASDTPDSREMEDGDTIEVYYEQRGGNDTIDRTVASPGAAEFAPGGTSPEQLYSLSLPAATLFLLHANARRSSQPPSSLAPLTVTAHCPRKYLEASLVPHESRV